MKAKLFWNLCFQRVGGRRHHRCRKQAISLKTPVDERYGDFATVMRSESVPKVEEIANCEHYRQKQPNEYDQEREPKATSFISTLVQIPDSVLPEKVIAEAQISRTDFLTAVISMVHLPSHNHLNRREDSEENNRRTQRDFVNRHKVNSNLDSIDVANRP